MGSSKLLPFLCKEPLNYRRIRAKKGRWPPKTDLAVIANVCYWHIADVPLALTNVCFDGKNGHDANGPLCLLMTQSGHSPLELISQSRLGGPGLSRSRRRLSALKRRVSSSSALFFSSRRVMRDFGSSLPRNFSSALSTESFSVMIQASPFGDPCRTTMDPDGRAINIL